MEEDNSTTVKDVKEDSPEAIELRSKVREFRNATASRALEIVHIVMPQKILDLDAKLKSSGDFSLKLTQVPVPTLPTAHTTSSAEDATPDKNKKKRKTKDDDEEESEMKKADNLVPSNKLVIDLLVPLKQEILELIENLNSIKLWIQLNIPRIEDGNNFGVSIQEETVNELGRSEEAGFAVLETMTKYYVTRAKLVSKVLKYPEIEDYRHSVIELDEKEYINLRLCILDLRNNYATLHDVISKNLEKLKTPRSSNHMNNMI